MTLFSRSRPLVGVIHLLPLPGSPRAKELGEVRRAAVADAKALASGGADAILVENFGDAPFYPGPVPPYVVSAMTVTAAEAREASRLPLGINVLRNDAAAALAVALGAGGAFIRVNVHSGAAETDQGRIEGRAWETLRLRKALSLGTQIWADVLVKHARPAGTTDPGTAARDTAQRGLADVLLVTGAETGTAAGLDRLRAVKRAAPERPVVVASGVTAENLGEFGEADGFIVGTALKRGGRVDNPVDTVRVKEMVRALNNAKNHARMTK